MDYPLPEGDICTLEYYPYDPDGLPDPLFIVEFLIPRFVNGTNIHMVCDIQQIIDVCNRKLEPLVDYPLEIPRIKVQDGMLKRIDLLYNHQVPSRYPQC